MARLDEKGAVVGAGVWEQLMNVLWSQTGTKEKRGQIYLLSRFLASLRLFDFDLTVWYRLIIGEKWFVSSGICKKQHGI